MTNLHVPELPRGIRNSNPGNIVKSHTEWKGEVPSDDERFETFDSPQDGLRALIKNLVAYKEDKNPDGTDVKTLGDMISRYAPPTENATSAYIAQVCHDTGLEADKPFDFENGDHMISVAKSIVMHENGNPHTYGYPDNWFPDTMYAAACDDAMGNQDQKAKIEDQQNPVEPVMPEDNGEDKQSEADAQAEQQAPADLADGSENGKR